MIVLVTDGTVAVETNLAHTHSHIGCRNRARFTSRLTSAIHPAAAMQAAAPAKPSNPLYEKRPKNLGELSGAVARPNGSRYRGNRQQAARAAMAVAVSCSAATILESASSRS